MQKVKLITQREDESLSDWQAEGGTNGPSDGDGYNRQSSKPLGQLVQENYAAGIVVAMISIPLSCALSIASGCTPTMGLISAIFGPAVSGLIGGSHYNILGPAGALVNINSKLVAENGMQIIPYVALLAGILTLTCWFLKLEQYCMLIPLSVLEGFSLGVATTIGLSQLRNAFGLKNLPKHTEFYMNALESFKNMDKANSNEYIPFLIFFVILFSLAKFLPGRPWIILIAFVGLIYGYFTDGSANKPTLLKDVYPEMLGASKLYDFSYYTSDTFVLHVPSLLVGAFEITFVAVLETLISAKIADNLTGTRFDQGQETFALGWANLLSGIMGGLPVTGVLVRTAANVASGANHKTS